MKLHLADDLRLPLDVVTEKLCWLGRTGSGKTYGAMKLAELMLDAGAQIGVLDPVGVWRALRVPAEKGGRAFDVVVFGGLYGDLPLEPSAGELIADLVVDRGLSFVLDVSQFIPADQQRFVQAFGARFFHRKKAQPSAVHLFLEECQEFVPENPSGRAEQVTLGVMQRLWKLGRNFGIGGSLISQRPQEVAKKALNMSGTMFAFQMTGPQERKTVKAWVADHGVAFDIESVLQTLQVGAPHVESPTFLEVSKTIRILPRLTADLSSTPKVGTATAAKRALTPIDVEALTAAMAATIERAKAEDPRELRKQVADLKQQLARAAKVAPPAPAKTKTVERFVLKEGQLARAEQLVERLTTVAQGIREAIGKTRDGVTLQDAHIPAFILPHLPPRAGTVVYRQGAAPPRAVAADGPTAIRTMHRAMLTTLAQHPDGLTKKQILVQTGYASSGPVSTAFADLVREGWVEPAGNRVGITREGWITSSGARLRITAQGLDVLGPYEPLPVGDALREWLLTSGKLSTMEKALLLQICIAYPDPIQKSEVLARAKYASSGPVSTAFAKLVAYGYAVPAGSARLTAARELFS